MERQQEPNVEDTLGPEGLSSPMCPRQRFGDVLELDLIQVGSGGDKVRDQALEILFRDRCRSRGLRPNGSRTERWQHFVAWRASGHLLIRVRERVEFQIFPLATS